MAISLHTDQVVYSFIQDRLLDSCYDFFKGRDKNLATPQSLLKPSVISSPYGIEEINAKYPHI